MINISLDVLSAERGSEVPIKAAFQFIKKNKNVKFFLVGNEEEILKITNKLSFPKEQLEIIDAKQKITSHDGILSIRRKPNSSMIQAINLVNNGKCDIVVSGGSSGVFLAACHLILKEIKGIERPAFMPFIPTKKNGVSLFLDVGATLEPKARDLYMFAHMAKIYAQEIFKISNPIVGLLNVGEEPTKGLDLHIKTNKILTDDKNINFYGNIEPRELLSGTCDILLSDGFSGNLILKTLEGTAETLLGAIKKQLTKNIFAKLRAAFVYSLLKNVKKTFNYKKYNGAFVIGLNKPAFKTHGSSDVQSYYAVIQMAYQNIENDVLNKIKKEIENETRI